MRTSIFCILALSLGGCSGDELGAIPPTGSVDGYLCNPVTEGLAIGAEVTGEGPDDPVSTTTDDTGFFTLGGLNVGEQTLEVSGGGWADSVAVTVVEDEVTRIPDPPCLEVGTGIVEGRICATETGIGSGEGYWLAYARVYIDVAGTLYETTADAEGRFTLPDVPAGTHTLRIEKGSFNATREVEVVEDETTSIDNVCVEPTTQLAVVTGIFDSVEDVLGDLGFGVTACAPSGASFCPSSLDPEGTITLVDGEMNWVAEMLEAPSELDQFDVIFFNCGLQRGFIESAPPDVETNLREWVSGGGSIYVSDLAYVIIRDIFPEVMTFYEDANESAEAGVLNNNLSATLVDTDLSSVVGQTTVTLDYDKGSWAVLDPAQPPEVNVWVSGDPEVDDDDDGTGDTPLTDAPLLVSAPFGEGRIVFTTFHTHEQASDTMQAILQFIVFEL